MTRKSNKAICRLETSLNEFCFIVQGIGVGTINKQKPIKQALKLAHK